jgi:hypothetical protein
MVWPFVECYWVAAVYLYTLKNREKELAADDFVTEVLFYDFFLK